MAYRWRAWTSKTFPELLQKFSSDFPGTSLTVDPRGPNDKKIQSRSKFSISIEILNLARTCQSRRLEFPTKNRAAVGGSLENFILARNFQSRSKSRIVLIFGPSGILKAVQGFPGSFPDFPGSSPALPRKFPGDNLTRKCYVERTCLT